MMNAKEGKLFQGFGVPGLNHVYISNKYSKNKDGSAILTQSLAYVMEMFVCLFVFCVV